MAEDSGPCHTTLVGLGPGARPRGEFAIPRGELTDNDITFSMINIIILLNK